MRALTLSESRHVNTLDADDARQFLAERGVADGEPVRFTLHEERGEALEWLPRRTDPATFDEQARRLFPTTGPDES